MEAVVYLDTHVVAWLYAGRSDLFPPGIRTAIDAATPRISPMVELELQYLFEIGRLKEPPDAVLPALRRSLGLVLCDRPFAEVSREGRRHGWTRDPFDRLITAQASVGEVRLITKNETILKNYARAFWG